VPGPREVDLMRAWFSQHRVALVSALRRLGLSPLNTLLSLFVIGIAMTLPAAGYVVLDNLKAISQNASGIQQISLFMAVEAGRKDAADIERRLKEVNAGPWRFVAREDALKHLQENEGLADIVASLPRNPLPDAFIVEPKKTEPEALEIMRKEIAGWPRVAHVQLDSAWVKRFDAFLRLGKLLLRQLGAQMDKVIARRHGRNGVRTGGARADLEHLEHSHINGIGAHGSRFPQGIKTRPAKCRQAQARARNSHGL